MKIIKKYRLFLGMVLLLNSMPFQCDPVMFWEQKFDEGTSIEKYNRLSEKILGEDKEELSKVFGGKEAFGKAVQEMGGEEKFKVFLAKAYYRKGLAVLTNLLGGPDKALEFVKKNGGYKNITDIIDKKDELRKLYKDFTDKEFPGFLTFLVLYLRA